jgi:preprotein translocase subunit SecE
MNREQKRAMQRAGQLNEDGTPAASRERRSGAQQRIREERTSPMQFVREVRAELRKVMWPNREETIRYSIIVAIAIVVLGAFIFLVDLGSARFTDFLFPAPSSAFVVLPFLRAIR